VSTFQLSHRLRLLAAIAAVATLAACAGQTRGAVPAGTTEPDKFLFDKGTAALNSKKWLTAREYFKQVTETYTQSAYRPDAKLGIGDTYLGEGTAEALVLALNEFREGGSAFAGKTITPVVAGVYVVGIVTKNRGIRDGVWGCVASYAFPFKGCRSGRGGAVAQPGSEDPHFEQNALRVDAARECLALGGGELRWAVPDVEKDALELV